MIWSLFPEKIRETFKIPKLFSFSLFDDSDNGRMFKFIICGVILLLLSLGGLGCVAIVTSLGGGSAGPAAPTTPASVPTPNIRMR